MRDIVERLRLAVEARAYSRHARAFFALRSRTVAMIAEKRTFIDDRLWPRAVKCKESFLPNVPGAGLGAASTERTEFHSHLP